MLGRPGALAAGFSVWVVAMLTTIGKRRAESSAKEAGAPRSGTGADGACAPRAGAAVAGGRRNNRRVKKAGSQTKSKGKTAPPRLFERFSQRNEQENQKTGGRVPA